MMKPPYQTSYLTCGCFFYLCDNVSFSVDRMASVVHGLSIPSCRRSRRIDEVDDEDDDVPPPLVRRRRMDDDVEDEDDDVPPPLARRRCIEEEEDDAEDEEEDEEENGDEEEDEDEEEADDDDEDEAPQPQVGQMSYYNMSVAAETILPDNIVGEQRLRAATLAASANVNGNAPPFMVAMGFLNPQTLNTVNALGPYKRLPRLAASNRSTLMGDNWRNPQRMKIRFKILFIVFAQLRSGYIDSARDLIILGCPRITQRFLSHLFDCIVFLKRLEQMGRDGHIEGLINNGEDPEPERQLRRDTNSGLHQLLLGTNTIVPTILSM